MIIYFKGMQIEIRRLWRTLGSAALEVWYLILPILNIRSGDRTEEIVGPWRGTIDARMPLCRIDREEIEVHISKSYQLYRVRQVHKSNTMQLWPKSGVDQT
jgi:hypothetical protein